MNKPIKWNDPPNLAVIDRAIELIRSEASLFTCVALALASDDVEPHTKHRFARRLLYTTQYRECVLGPEGIPPHWWSEVLRRRKKERIAALKKFRKACIDAAKEKS